MPVDEPLRRPSLPDDFRAKIAEVVETSDGQDRADALHERLVAMGFSGDERTAGRAVARTWPPIETGAGVGIGPGSPDME